MSPARIGKIAAARAWRRVLDALEDTSLDDIGDATTAQLVAVTDALETHVALINIELRRRRVKP